MNDKKSREVYVDIALSLEVNCVFQTKILACSEHLEFHVVVVVLEVKDAGILTIHRLWN